MRWDRWDALAISGSSLIVGAIGAWSISLATGLVGAVLLGLGVWGASKRWDSSQRS